MKRQHPDFDFLSDREKVEILCLPADVNNTLESKHLANHGSYLDKENT
jgi:hypothetical protein